MNMKTDRISKEKRKEILKDLGYDKEDMKYFWRDCIEERVPLIMEYYDAGYISWKDLPEEVMRTLPDLRNEYLKSQTSGNIAKQATTHAVDTEYALNLAKEIRESIAEDSKVLQWDNSCKHINRDVEKSNAEFGEQLTFEEDMYHKITSGERLTEKELKKLVFESNQIDEIEGDDHRWTRSIETIVCLCGHYFSISWQRALTEMQEHEFYNQPVQVKPVEKLIKETMWVPLSAEVQKPPTFVELPCNLGDKLWIIERNRFTEEYELHDWTVKTISLNKKISGIHMSRKISELNSMEKEKYLVIDDINWGVDVFRADEEEEAKKVLNEKNSVTNRLTKLKTTTEALTEALEAIYDLEER